MRILYYHQHFSTRQGSGGTRSYEISRRLVEKGHEVTVVCGGFENAKLGFSQPFVSGRREGLIDGIRVIELEIPYSNKMSFLTRSLAFLRYAAKSTALAMTEKYDLIFATSTPLTAGIPGIFAKIFRRKTFVFEVRDLWPELPKAMGAIRNPLILGILSVLEWLSYHCADLCIGLSPGISKGIEKRGIKKERICLVPNGSDVDLFGSQTLEVLSPPRVGADDFMAIFTGTHGMANGLEALIPVAQELKRSGADNIKLVFIGDGAKKKMLMDSAEEHGLNNCIFMSPVPKVQLSRYLARADVGMMILANVEAFYYGTSPNKFFDYLAAGKPIICNYPGWVSDLIEDNKCGVSVPPESHLAFAQALMSLAQKPREELQAMGRQSLGLAQREFDRDLLVDRWITAVTQCYKSQGTEFVAQ